jgi:hypothetical protein
LEPQKGATNICEGIDQEGEYEVTIAPYGCATQTVDFARNPPKESWRLIFAVAEELQGGRKLFAASRRYISEFTFNAFSNETHYRRRFLTMSSGEFPAPKEAR